MALRAIATREATVKTATVAVKTLTISGKQVTLSVFRQLISEDLVEEHTGNLVGVPWGTVNYFWGDCAPNHLHVVWQKGDELRRACVYPQTQPARAWRMRAGLLRERAVLAALNAAATEGSELNIARIGHGGDWHMNEYSQEFRQRGRFYIISDSSGAWRRIDQETYRKHYDSHRPELTVAKLPGTGTDTGLLWREGKYYVTDLNLWKAAVARAQEKPHFHGVARDDEGHLRNAYEWTRKVLPNSNRFMSETSDEPQGWADWWLASFAFPEAAEIYDERAGELERTWKQRYAELSALDQLFIAI